MDSININEILNTKRVKIYDEVNGVNLLYGLYDLIRENFSKDFVICEVGSFEGCSSVLFATTCKKVFCVDQWIPYRDIDDKNIMESAERSFDEKLKKCKNIVKLKGSSEEISETFSDHFFDAVYIDANHTYDYVKNDILKWLPKIKKDGFICGHDYSFLPDVKKAVDEIFTECDIKVYSDSSWLVDLKKIYDKINLSSNGLVNMDNNEAVPKEKGKSSIFVIDAWTDTPEKENSLRDCISQCREIFNCDILVISHYPVPADIQKLSNYYIYDRENPILYRDEYKNYNISSYWWFANDDYTVTTAMEYRHDYAIWTSMKNAFNFAFYLQKDNIFFFEFDHFVDVDFFRKEFINSLDNYDVCYVPMGKSSAGNEMCRTGVFSIKTKAAVDISNSVLTKKEYFDTSCRLQKYFLEEFFHFLISSRTDSLSSHQVEDKNKAVSERIFSTFEENVRESVFFCKDENDYVYCLISVVKSELQESTISIIYMGREENLRVDSSSPFIIVGLCQKCDLTGDFIIKQNEKVIYHQKHQGIIDDVMFGSVSPANGKSLSTFRNYFSNKKKEGAIVKMHSEKNINRYMDGKLRRVNFSFINVPKIEILGDGGSTYRLYFIDQRSHAIIYMTVVPLNNWAVSNRIQFTHWLLMVCGDNVIVKHNFDLEFKRCYIHLGGVSIEDHKLWMPYVNEFRKRHSCEMFCSSFDNMFFKKLYPKISFVDDGSILDDIYAQYTITYQHPDYAADSDDFRISLLPKMASDMLGLEDYKPL